MKYRREDFMENGVVAPEVTDTAIYGLFLEYRCLSNFHWHPVEFEGLVYPCSEAAYMAQKTLDIEIKKLFTQVDTATEAKRLGQEVKLRDDWDDIHRIHAMYRVNLAKFTQDQSSLIVLLSTGNKYIEETNWWKDTYWGKCGGIGKNHLGQILMTIRDFMRSMHSE